MLAPAADVYQLISEVRHWPRIFPPTVHVEHLGGDGGQERIQIWATANGEPKTWTSLRTLHPESLRVDFLQEISSPPVDSMSGTWIVEPVSEKESVLRLLHDFRAVDDDPDDLEWIDKAVDRNSRSELAAIKANIELDVHEGRTISFEDSVHIEGSVRDVFDFINEAGLWKQRLPHVDRVSCTEETSGLQVLEMDTRGKDGSVHTTKSIRICLAPDLIVYKQITLPPILTLHIGRWSIEEDGSGITVTSQHTVVIDNEEVPRLLGPDVGLSEAKDRVRKTLGANSLATLALAKEYAEQRASSVRT